MIEALISNDETYETAYYKDCNLLTEKQTFSYTFTYERETMNQARISFDFGLADAQYIYFDNVYLYETAPSSTSEIITSKCTVKAGKNIFTVEGNSIEAITIYDVSGRICYEKTYPHVNSVEIGDAYLLSGISLIRVRTDVKNTVVKNLKRK